MIQKKTGPVSLLVRLSDGREHRCHLDQPEIVIPSVIPSSLPVNPSVATPSPANDSVVDSSPSPAVVDPEPPPEPVPETRVKTYPKRDRKPVERFEPKW